MEIPGKKTPSLLPGLTGVVALFLFFMCAASLGLYVWGAFREFTEADQLFLLKLSLALGILTGLSSLCCVLINLAHLGPFFSGRKAPKIFAAVSFALAGILGTVVSLAAAFVLSLSKGTGS